MPIFRVWAGLFLLACLAMPAWSQTDPQGREYAWQLFAAYEQGEQSQSYEAFETLFMADPALTKRAFLSTMEYATEIYQGDLESAREAVAFATELAGLIGQQFQDPVPSSMMSKLSRGDQSVANDFASYASALYPGYAALFQSAGSPGGANGYDQGPGAYPSDKAPPHSAPANTQPQPPQADPSSGPFRPANTTGGPPKN